MQRVNRLHLILRLFTIEKPLWTIEEAASALSVSLSTAYRQFSGLVQSGLLDAIEGSRVYVLGPAIVQLDRNIRLSDPLITVAKPTMQWLAEQAPVSCTVILCRLYRDRVMCIHEEKGDAGGDVSYERGRLMPLSRGAPSKTILAQLSRKRLSAFVETLRAESSTFDTDEFRRELAGIRKQGHAITRGEVDPGVMGLAVPLATPFRGIVASLGVACFGAPDEISMIRTRALLTAAAETIKGSITHDAHGNLSGR